MLVCAALVGAAVLHWGWLQRCIGAGCCAAPGLAAVLHWGWLCLLEACGRRQACTCIQPPGGKRVLSATCVNPSLFSHIHLQLKSKGTITEMLFPSRGASETFKLCTADQSCLPSSGAGVLEEAGSGSSHVQLGGLWVARVRSRALHAHPGHSILPLTREEPLLTVSVGWHQKPKAKGEVPYAAASQNASRRQRGASHPDQERWCVKVPNRSFPGACQKKSGVNTQNCKNRSRSCC